MSDTLLYAARSSEITSPEKIELYALVSSKPLERLTDRAAGSRLIIRDSRSQTTFPLSGLLPSGIGRVSGYAAYVHDNRLEFTSMSAPLRMTAAPRLLEGLAVVKELVYCDPLNDITLDADGETPNLELVSAQLSRPALHDLSHAMRQLDETWSDISKPDGFKRIFNSIAAVCDQLTASLNVESDESTPLPRTFYTGLLRWCGYYRGPQAFADSDDIFACWKLADLLKPFAIDLLVAAGMREPGLSRRYWQ